MKKSALLAVLTATLGWNGAALAQRDTPPAIRSANARIDRLVAVPDSARTFENTVEALDDVIAHLELDTGYPMFMAYVSTDPDERAAGSALEEAYTNWLDALGRNEGLYRALTAFAASEPALDPVQRRMLDDALRMCRRAGMALDASTRRELAGVQQEITKLSLEFERNIREDATVVPLLPEELAGMPADYLGTLTRTGRVYLVGLSYPEFLPIMDLCPSEATREKMWVAFKRRGGEQNVRVLEQLLKLRNTAAKLLGYDNAAAYEIEERMAKTPDTVMAFYEKLRPLVRTKARQDYAELLAMKVADTGDTETTLKPWDSSYYTNMLRREKYAVDSEEVKQYFPLDRVTDGLFSITQSLYGITYKEVTDRAEEKGRELWHPEVQLFEVWDDASGEILGEFAIDLHPRANKFGHAAQWGLIQHKVWSDGTETKPYAALVCNFTRPTADKPALMSHDEVETYFHEFGHCLHTLLSEATYWSVAGTNVERDFVEAPSQMFENWVWDADVLATFAGHYETGAPLPPAMLDGMIAARNLGSGMLAERQFFYGMFDMACHLDDDGVVDTTALAHDMWGELGEGVELYAAVPETYFHAAFGHLTGYQAGYYGYQWSLVYACDMFQRFKELGMLDPKAGMYYRRKILAAGGTKDGLDLVREYLGREPEMSSYLKHLGLETTSAHANE